MRARLGPRLVVLLAAGAVALIVIPLAGLMWRAPWSALWSEATSAEALTALRLSLLVSMISTLVSVVVGVPLAWILARVSFPARSLVRGVITLPLVLPPVVGGIALLFAFGRRGLVGQYLDEWFGLRLPFTTAGAVLAAVFVAMPFLVLTVESGFRRVDRRLEEAGRTLGAGRWFLFRRVTLPLVLPSLAAGMVLAWARALGEFGATITFAGNFPGRTQTVPLAAFLALERDPEGAIVLSLVLLAVSIAVLAALRDRWLGAL